MRDSLDSVRGLRVRAVDEARQTLAAGLAAAAAAHATASDAERVIDEETERASDPRGTDQLVEAFAAWLPGARHRAAQARAVHVRLEAEVGRLRAELQASRSALESIEALIAERRAAQAAEQARRWQRDLDEMGSKTGDTGS